MAQSNIAAQEAQIRILEQEKAYQRVVAPFDGVITQRNIDNGSLVTSGSTFMFTLMHPDVIRTQVFVPQDEAFGLGPGVDAVVRVPEIPDRTFPGKVTRIASALQPGSRTLLTEIDVPNPDGALSPGIYCTVELYIPRKTPSMIIPADAIVFDQNGLHVAVVENGAAHLQKITIARDFGTEVEVHDGVKPGDQVILNPMVNLAEGSKVRGAQNSNKLDRHEGRNGDATPAVQRTVLLLGCSASLAQVSTIGTTAMGLSSTPGTIVTSPLNGPSPFSATTQPGAPDTTLAPVPLASDPAIPGTVVTCTTPAGQITPGTPAVPVASMSSTAAPSERRRRSPRRRRHRQYRLPLRLQPEAPSVRTTSYIIHDRFSRREPFRRRSRRPYRRCLRLPLPQRSTDVIDGTEPSLDMP